MAQIDIRHERPIPFREVPALPCIPGRRNGARLNIATVHRWHRHGLGGVRLEGIKVGGVLCTSLEALQRFFDRLTGTSSSPPTLPQSTPPHVQQRVEQRLDDLGVGQSACD